MVWQNVGKNKEKYLAVMVIRHIITAQIGLAIESVGKRQLKAAALVISCSMHPI